MKVYEVTQEALAAAFTKWETEHRTDPSKFMTAAQCRSQDAKTYGERCAIELLHHLKELCP